MFNKKKITQLEEQVERATETIVARNNEISDMKEEITQLKAHIERYESIKADMDKFRSFDEAISIKTNDLKNIECEIEKRRVEFDEISNKIKEKRNELNGLNELDDLIHFYPDYDKQYDYPSYCSEELKEMLKDTEKLIKEDQCNHSAGIVCGVFRVPWEDAYCNWNRFKESMDKQLQKDFAILLASCFTNEVNHIIDNMKFGGETVALNKIMGSYNYFNKIAERYDCKIDTLYTENLMEKAKYKNAMLVALNEEKEERRRQAEIIREQQKLEREIETKQKELEKQLKDANEEEAKEINSKIEELEKKKKSRAGWLYVISNPDMYDGLYKLGITRRENPFDRVDELSDASHSFKFNVHGFIYSEDCFDLETKIHRYFADRRFNVLNQHKEHFFCTLDEVEEALKSLGYETKLDRHPANDAFEESVRVLKERKVWDYGKKETED